MKKVKKVLSKLTEHERPTTRNFAGSVAWDMNPESSFKQLMYTGTCTASFYVSEANAIESAYDTVDSFTKANPEKASEHIVGGRKEGFIRTAPIMALACLSKHSPEHFKKIFCDVVITGNDMGDFIDMLRSIGRGFGRGVKTAINKWLSERVTPFYAMKYTKQISDAIRLARPKNAGPCVQYCYAATAGKPEQTERSREFAEQIPQLFAFLTAMDFAKADEWDEAIPLITEHRLDPTSFLGIPNIPSNVWTALAPQMGTMAFLKNLNKIHREGALTLELMQTMLTCERLQKAKVFPYRLVIAHHHFDGPVWAKTHLSNVLNEYVKTYSWDTWKERTIAILPDVSGSMRREVRGSAFRPAVVAGYLSGIFALAPIGAVVVPWEDGVDEKLGWKIATTKNSVMAVASLIANANGGGTAMGSGVEYLHKFHQPENKKAYGIESKHPDLLILITDSMETLHAGLLRAWIEYKKQFKEAELVIIRVDAYPTNPISDADCRRYGVHQVFGWNDSVIPWIERVVLSK